jgi:hypothetical protein
MRSAGDENAQQLQYQHEEDMLKQCQTAKKKSKHRNLMSPGSPNSLGEIDQQMGMSPSGLTPGSNSKDSKGSPNEEKNKQIYKNLLAQQCLGQDVFTMQSQYDNLSNPISFNQFGTGQSGDMFSGSKLPTSIRNVNAQMDTPIVNSHLDQHSGLFCNSVVSSFNACSRI